MDIVTSVYEVKKSNSGFVMPLGMSILRRVAPGITRVYHHGILKSICKVIQLNLQLLHIYLKVLLVVSEII